MFDRTPFGQQSASSPDRVLTPPVRPQRLCAGADKLPILTQPPEAPATGASTGGATMRAWLPCCGALTLA